ncbi:MAG: response regulator transcription factor [Acidobacteria bacterium]|nr:MAG: response regulator transcription factor [Acidobacteriota bacterium]
MAYFASTFGDLEALLAAGEPTQVADAAPVLLIEDDAHIRRSIVYQFHRQGYRVTCCADGEAGLEEALKHNYCVVILDLMLPKLDGFTVCKQLRQSRKDLPIIIISARGSDIDKITGLGLGADDYVAKPFSPAELEARVRALRRRTGSFEPEPIAAGGMVLDCTKYQLTIGGAVVRLTPKELKILRLLMNSPGRVFTRENLLTQVWGVAFEGYHRAIDAHMSRLKIKLLEQAGEPPDWLESVYGVGYRFRDPAEKMTVKIHDPAAAGPAAPEG